jgi:4-amino-4-deoxy-L-arabinose transferase-like glycosyltransferase
MSYGALTERRLVILLTAAAVALRFLMFMGRGDYVAFDEGWYLLLGRNLMNGAGFSLAGLRHATLSPLFPLLAGAVDVVLGHAIWSGRIVAALAAALLVVPCYSIFRRLAGRRTATLACVIVMALPALAPFVVPYWIGRDLWVGAEPLLHLFLFSGVALVLRGRHTGRALDYAGAGVSFSLAYLARPEAIVTLGVVGLILGGLALFERRPRRLVHAAVLGLAFGLVSAPYWIYLHDVLGRWAVTGRGIVVTRMETQQPPRPGSARAGGEEAGPTEAIEQMLWRGDATRYVQRLYALDATGLRLASDYWGVQQSAAASAQPTAPAPPAAPVDPAAAPARTAEAAPAGEAPASRFRLYGRALSWILPWYTLPLLLIGVLSLRTRRRGLASDELLFVVPVAFTAMAIAALVAIDPRTQLILLPVAAFYLARGLRAASVWLAGRFRHSGMSRRFAALALSGAMAALLFGTQAQWLYLSLSVGSPHHMAGASNREVGALLQRRAAPAASVMSWHPAIALYARRDWRVLPHASFDNIVRYAGVVGTSHVVLSRYYPGPPISDELSSQHVLLHVPATPEGTHWHLRVDRGEGSFVFAELVAEPPRAAGVVVPEVEG